MNGIEIIAGLEQFILDQEDCEFCPFFVPLPYWDITKPLPTEFWNQMIPEFEDAFLFDAVSSDPLHDGTASFKSDPLQTWPNYQVTTEDCEEYEDIDDFASFIQGWHGSVHNEMGGAMRSTTATSGTSVFWLYHAFVDEKYYCYQQLCQCPEPVAQLNIRKCDVCFDLSNSLNSDEFDLTLIDDQGNETIISLNSEGCISSNYLDPGEDYILSIKAINSAMTDNIACLSDQIELTFTSPDPPSTNLNQFHVLKLL